MYEYHGWATVRQSPGDEEERVNILVEELRVYLTQRYWGTGLLDLAVVNGQYLLTFAGATNHRPTAFHDPVEWLQHVGQVAPGSYGVLYVWDDEDGEGLRNAFQVYVLVRGKVRQHEDRFLSPCIPVIEDP